MSFAELYEKFRKDQEIACTSAGVPSNVMDYAKRSGFNPFDISRLCEFSHKKQSIVLFRCANSAAWVYPDGEKKYGYRVCAKPGTVKQKTNEFGVIIQGELLLVSDYDVMGWWERDSCGKFNRISLSKKMGHNNDGENTKQVAELVRELNVRLKRKIQHGFNDDWGENDLSPSEKFIAFRYGKVEFYEGLGELKCLYGQIGEAFPYFDDGVHKEHYYYLRHGQGD